MDTNLGVMVRCHGSFYAVGPMFSFFVFLWEGFIYKYIYLNIKRERLRHSTYSNTFTECVMGGLMGDLI